MSNPRAIAAVTATLRHILDGTLRSLLQHVYRDDTELQNILITTKPPDKARDDQASDQLNLFLYQVLPNAAWRNMDIPQHLKSGETGIPPLALNLYYMLTAYGKDNDDIRGHRLLGLAMSTLYDHALLSASDIHTALVSGSNELNSELQNQVERVRITLQPLSVEEIFRLWSGFQTQYRVSVSYEVCVVLIDSTQPTKTPLPVLTRGSLDDKGVTSQPNLIPSFPTIDDLVLPHPPSALLPDNLPPNDPKHEPNRSDLTLKGHDLLPGPDPTRPPEQQVDNTKTQVRFMNPRWLTTVDLKPKLGATKTAEEITVALPDSPTNWPAGFYTVSVVFRNANGDEVLTSNEIPFSLAPQILSDPKIGAVRSGNKVTITLRCTPAIQRTVQRMEPGGPQKAQQEQRVSLLVGDREVPLVFPAPPPPPPIDALTPKQDLTFEIKDLDLRPLPAGDYFVRLRVDGIDSLLVDRTVTPPKFDPSQKVTIP
jgi:hypothetical protein